MTGFIPLIPYGPIEETWKIALERDKMHRDMATICRTSHAGRAMMKDVLVSSRFKFIVTNTLSELVDVVNSEITLEHIRQIKIRFEKKSQTMEGHDEEILVAWTSASLLMRLPAARMSDLIVDLNGTWCNHDISFLTRSISHLTALTRLDFLGFDETYNMDISPLNVASLRSFSTDAGVTPTSLVNLPSHLTNLKLSMCYGELRSAIIGLLPNLSELRILELDMISFRLESLTFLSKLDVLKITDNKGPCILPSSLQKLHVVTNSWSFEQLSFVPTSLKSLSYEICLDMDIPARHVDPETLLVSLDYIVTILLSHEHLSAITSLVAVFTIYDGESMQQIIR
jgi:hypothetical protein